MKYVDIAVPDEDWQEDGDFNDQPAWTWLTAEVDLKINGNSYFVHAIAVEVENEGALGDEMKGSMTGPVNPDLEAELRAAGNHPPIIMIQGTPYVVTVTPTEA